MDSRPSRRARSTGPSRSGPGRDAATGFDPLRAGPRLARPPSRRGTRNSPTSRRSDTAPAALEGSVVDRSLDRVASVIIRPGGTGPGTAPQPRPDRGCPPGSPHQRARHGRTEGVRNQSQLVRQVVVLALVFFAVAFAVAVPLRNYLSQRTELAATVSQEQLLRTNWPRSGATAILSDPAFIMSRGHASTAVRQARQHRLCGSCAPLPAAKPVGPAAPSRPTTPGIRRSGTRSPTRVRHPAMRSQGSAPVPTNIVKSAGRTRPQGRSTWNRPMTAFGSAVGLQDVTDADREAFTQQLGRPPRGVLAVAYRCGHDVPAVVLTAPRLEDGTPFPTMYYLCCRELNAAVSRMESAGLMREMTERMARTRISLRRTDGPRQLPGQPERARRPRYRRHRRRNAGPGEVSARAGGPLAGRWTWRQPVGR